MALEINLVPDIKNEMIKTLKLRNFIFFLCIIIASASVAVTFIFGVIVGGQSIAIDSKQSTINALDAKLDSFSDRDDFLTIKDQLGNISSIAKNKKVASRTFNILAALIPTGTPDSIQISELSIDLAGEEGNPTFTLEAQANAGQAPYIDYNVLDAFKKSMKYMRYDYGNYVDKDNNTIPAYCIIERDTDGSHFSDPDKGKYAFWTFLKEGCSDIAISDNEEEASAETETETEAEEEESENEGENGAENQQISFEGYTVETYDDTPVVRIWRTPQTEWYNPNATADKPQMTENGDITNVAHFNSKCIQYKLIIKNDKASKIDDTENSCNLVSGEEDDDRIAILESSNGRDASEQLVLRFSAVLQIAPEVYDFNNFHMLALPPAERRNVTDSYVQLQTIFGERAKDCAEGDTACKTNGGN